MIRLSGGFLVSLCLDHCNLSKFLHFIDVHYFQSIIDDPGDTAGSGWQVGKHVVKQSSMYFIELAGGWFNLYN